MRTLVTLLLAGGVAACSAATPIEIDGPADPAVSVPASRYVPVLAGTKDYRPGDPKPWIGEVADEGDK